MAYKTTAETTPYKTQPNSDANASSEKALNADSLDNVGSSDDGKRAYKSSGCSYTPNAKINERSYGRDGSTNILGKIPEVVVGGSSEVGQVPAMPGTLRIGDNKNVSTPVSG